MSYPNVTDADVRNDIAMVTTAVVGTVLMATKIVEATNLTESKFVGKIDLTSLKALSTTPPLWQLMIIYKSRALALLIAYSSSRLSGVAKDIEYWETLWENMIANILSGKEKMTDSSGNIISAGIGFASIKTNKDDLDAEHEGPFFGYGDDGEHRTDINERTQENDPRPNTQ